jgi:hypothetical protein
VGSNATADAASLVISKGFLVYNVLVTDSNFLPHRIIVDAGKDKDEEVTVEQEEQIEEAEQDEEKDGDTIKDFNLGSIKAVYRNLRENYEYRMRYDEAGQFFIREMELKRKYREAVSSKDDGFKIKVKQNNWFRRNLFSLTGWYYHLSRYGESIWRPTLAGLVIVFLSTLFWLTQNNPTLPLL